MTLKEKILAIKKLRKVQKGKIISNCNQSLKDCLNLGVIPTRIYTRSQVSERDKKLLKSKRKIKL